MVVNRFIFFVFFGTFFLHSSSPISVYPSQDFNTALSDCSNRGLSLPVAETYDEYQLLLQYLQDNKVESDIWLGLRVPEGETRYKWVHDGYQDGGYLQTKWADDEPNNLDTPEYCVRLKGDDNYLWNTRQCDDRSEFVCVNYSNSDTDFQLFTDEETYDDARKTCRDTSKDLPMLKTQKQYDLILELINENSGIGNIWMGMKFVGSKSDDYREFKWLDDERINTADWVMRTSSDPCVFMEYSNSFKWESESCSKTKQYICTPTFRIHNNPALVSGFKRIGNNMEPYSEPLEIIETRSIRECCVQCSQLTSCKLVTTMNTTCKLFKNSDLSIYKGVVGSTVWKIRT